jgi:hypothetical protein
MQFRKRKEREEPNLAERLAGYHASATTPYSPTSAVATIRCWQCKRPNVYDARRRPPGRCVWCRCVL